MVNYLYDLRKHAQHHESYASAGTIATTSEIKTLASAAAARLPKEGNKHDKSAV